MFWIHFSKDKKTMFDKLFAFFFRKGCMIIFLPFLPFLVSTSKLNWIPGRDFITLHAQLFYILVNEILKKKKE